MDYDEWLEDEPACDICGDPDAPYVRPDGREVCADHREDGDPAVFRRIRLTLGMNVSDAAEACGVQPRTVRRWESGGAWPPPADAQATMVGLWDKAVDEVAEALASGAPATLRVEGLARMVAAVNARR